MCSPREISRNTEMGNGSQVEPLLVIRVVGGSQGKQKLVNTQDCGFCGHIIIMKILHLLCILNSNGISRVLKM